MDRDDAAYKGQREYTPLFLTIYDPLILGFFAPVVWRCPATRLVEGYRRHLGHRHLDVGPGTGYFLARAGIPDGSPITLLDPNPHVLAMHRGGCSAWTSRPSRPTSASHSPSKGRSTLPRCLACSIACQDRSRARLLPSPTWPPSSLRRASSSVHRSSGTQGTTPGCRAASSRPTTGEAPSTTSMTPRRASRDPRSIVRAGGARDRRLDGHIRGHESAHEPFDGRSFPRSRGQRVSGSMPTARARMPATSRSEQGHTLKRGCLCSAIPSAASPVRSEPMQRHPRRASRPTRPRLRARRRRSLAPATCPSRVRPGGRAPSVPGRSRRPSCEGTTHRCAPRSRRPMPSRERPGAAAVGARSQPSLVTIRAGPIGTYARAPGLACRRVMPVAGSFSV